MKVKIIEPYGYQIKFNRKPFDTYTPEEIKKRNEFMKKWLENFNKQKER
jgi:hypothetical protein